ncbi:baseplate J/gp47 family protein [Brevibacillus dissolubilis]|uniref:baseplate J/gp47 family protein n=1 Tax=Brevibacillus dissolubilis TaxID=1844116 RepID=UPI001116CCA8|nr:baseplate J/gp47 family protein [Brevibacillus dissolubilis]
MSQTSQEIFQRMITAVDNRFNKAVGSFISDVLKAYSLELTNWYGKVDEWKKKLQLDNLSGDELAQRIYERTGISRNQATKASTYILLTGNPGTPIVKGDRVASDTMSYIVTEAVQIGAGGTAQTTVECTLPGSLGNVPANAIKSFPMPIEGITSVTNLEPVTNGFDAETDEALLQRYYERVRTPATSGNRHHYRNWAKEVVGVGDAKVIPLWNGDNTVKIIIIDANKQPASDELVAQVQAYIDPGSTGLGDGVAPLGARCTVESAVARTISISFTGVTDPAVAEPDRIRNLEENLRDYLASCSFTGIHPSYAKIGNIILNTHGYLDYSNLLVNGGTANIQLADNEVPILGGVTVA